MLASFVVVAYNQEKYIREAVEGAFSQTYSPLEIILSDDCSTDSTFAIMQEMAREYKGPHKIILNRNEKNLGIVGHVNRTAEIFSGEVWIGAAGDDISLPERSSVVLNCFTQNTNTRCVTVGAELFGDSKGFVIPWALNRKLHLMEVCGLNMAQQGSTASYHKSVFSEFCPLSPLIKGEDFPLTFRSCLLGIRIALDDILVKYRSHKGSICNNPNISLLEGRSTRVSLSGMQQAWSDFNYFTEKRGINAPFARLALQLQLLAYDRLARAADAKRHTDFIAFFILKFLSIIKLFRLLHIQNWLEARNRASLVKHISLAYENTK